MKSKDGEALSLFLAFLDRERAAAVKVATNLTEPRRRQYLDDLNSEERRLDLFERWRRTAGPAAVAGAADPNQRADTAVAE